MCGGPARCSRDRSATFRVRQGHDGAILSDEVYANNLAQFVDEARAAGINCLAADRYDALGQEKTATYFNDNQHAKKSGARVNAACLAEALRQLKDCSLARSLAAGP